MTVTNGGSEPTPTPSPLHHATVASDLLRASDYRAAVPPLSEQFPNATAEDAYLIQVSTVADRISRNDPLIGAKVGVHQRKPVFSLYPRSSLMGTFEVADLSRLIRPVAQPVFVLRLLRELEGTEVTEQDVRDATESVVAGIEVVDHRMVHPNGLEHVDVIADNGGIAKLLIGEHGVNISAGRQSSLDLEVSFSVDGVDTGPAPHQITAPLAAVAALANHLGSQGGRLEAGWFVVVGPLRAPAPLTVGSKVQLDVQSMASVRLRAR